MREMSSKIEYILPCFSAAGMAEGGIACGSPSGFISGFLVWGAGGFMGASPIGGFGGNSALSSYKAVPEK